MVGSPRPQADHSLGTGIALTPQCQRYLANPPFRAAVPGHRRKTTSDGEVRLREKQYGRARLAVELYAR